MAIFTFNVSGPPRFRNNTPSFIFFWNSLSTAFGFTAFDWSRKVVAVLIASLLGIIGLLKRRNDANIDSKDSPITKFRSIVER
jgi:hypothetical protein